MTISFLIILSVLFLYSALNKLRIFQLNGYKISKSSTLKKIIFIDNIFSVVTFLIFILFFVYDEKVLAYLLLLSGLILYIDIFKVYERQKLKYTKRGVRLIFTLYVLIALIMYFIDKYIFLLMPLINGMLYLLIVLSNIINSPIEKLIKCFYLIKAKEKVKKRKYKVIGITGSAGKSTTKYILSELLSIKYTVFKSEKNFNTDWGVIKSLKRVSNEEILIFEMGARNKKDIQKIARIIKPEIGVLTSVIKQHLNTFKSIENIYLTKRELQDYKSVKVMFFNDRNVLVNKMKEECNKEKFGIKDIEYKDVYFDGKYQHFSIIYDNTTYHLKTQLLGSHNIENIILALQVALYFKIEIKDLIEKIENLSNIEHRFSIKKEGEVTIIDDSYNANIDGCMNALNFLKNFNGRKIIFTQGIVELGMDQEKENTILGMKIASVADYVILLGVNQNYIKKGLLKERFNDEHIIVIDNFSKINGLFKEIIKKGDVVLIQNDLTDNY